MNDKKTLECLIINLLHTNFLQKQLKFLNGNYRVIVLHNKKTF